MWHRLRVLSLALCLFGVPTLAYADLQEAQRLLQRGEYEAAFKLLAPMGEQGNRAAQYFIGLMYRNGHGVQLSYESAIAWLRKSALQGDPRAQYSLSSMYAHGLGVPRDPPEAIRWLQLAADQRYARAQATLGSFYERGEGVAKDLVQSYVWYDVAIRSARDNDQIQGMVDGRERVQRLLSASDLARARQLAVSWQPKRTVSSPAPPVDPPQPSKTNAPARSSGSGFIISRLGHVLTNHHVVDECQDIRAALPGDPMSTLRLVARDARNDLALLKLAGAAPISAVFRDGRGVRVGDSVVAVGFPLRGLLASGVHVTTGTVSALAGTLDDSSLLQTTAPVQPGNSGGPLLDQNGYVVGVVVGKLDALKVAKATGDLPQNVGFALTASIARSFLDANSVEYETAAAPRQWSTADVAERARKFTLVIECTK